MTDQPTDMPQPRRRRVADPTPDPMASPAPAPAPVAATISPARTGRRRSGEPTVSVFVRTEVATKDRFETMADEDETTARALFEKLIAEEWDRRHDRHTAR